MKKSTTKSLTTEPSATSTPDRGSRGRKRGDASFPAAPPSLRSGLRRHHEHVSPSDRSDPADPSKYSTWPSGTKGARPRSATVVIRKRDGGIIGT